MSVPVISWLHLFVNSPVESSAFYTKLLNINPVEESPTYALFALPNGLMLGLWSALTAEPSVLVGGGGSEICFIEDDVDQIYANWMRLGIPMAQTPTDMDFGRTFVALDPDGHRIRVFRLIEEHS